MKNRIIGFEICTLAPEAFEQDHNPHKQVQVYRYSPEPFVTAGGQVTDYHATIHKYYHKNLTRSSMNRVLRAMLKVGQIA